MTRRQPTSSNEIRSLCGVVGRDLKQAETPGLCPDGRFTFLYNAALQLSTIVLRLNDLRVGQTGHHRETFRAVERLLPADICPLLLHFEHARRKRNTLMYDQAGTVSEHEVADLRESVCQFEAWVPRGLTGEYLSTRDAQGGSRDMSESTQGFVS